jgi:hypothetical protein
VSCAIADLVLFGYFVFAKNDLSCFMWTPPNAATAQGTKPLSAILTATVQTSTEVQQLENNL